MQRRGTLTTSGRWRNLLLTYIFQHQTFNYDLGWPIYSG